MGQFHNLWQTEQRKVHLQRLDLDHIKLEARTLAKTSKKNVEYCRKITMERNNIVVELRSRLHLLPSLKYEVNTLQVELENERTELKKEIAEFEGKVAQRIEWHTSSWEVEQAPLEQSAAVIHLTGAEDTDRLMEDPDGQETMDDNT
ncbi:hypothetical protein U1Q18_007557 [Sarracenia purpurea var. burkii]